ncbi:hypothetical protein [Kordiimonas sp. SCSIO 12610]|uniref:hypothetical protein n=1 Tax=Kordiimonas sp. SCSIO 12610 TaxID=2829597 RepID=UPI002109BF02|nr:hypothetical protein [Kordiimonas sp. SCSIO 12610]UTW54579.1 hypothetical protein KFF44_12310 [Kordiimonas sp. SCSIO 12610]
MSGHKYTIRMGYILILIILGLNFTSGDHSAKAIRKLSAEEKAAYIDQLEIYEFFARRVELVGGHKQPAIWFRLRNKSDVSFSQVRVKINFFDKKQRLIHESYFHPVHDNTSFNYAIDSLAPEQVWQMSHSRYYIPTGVPTHWRDGNAYAEIVDVEINPNN